MVRSEAVVLVVAYGRPDLLDAALQPLASRLETVVVDNGASDGTRSIARQHGATYVLPERNLGFAAGVNRGLSVVGSGRDVLLLNPDAALPPDGVRRLQQVFDDDDRVAAAAPRLRRPDGSWERTLWPVPRPRTPWYGVVGREDLHAAAHFLNGAVLLLRSEALVDVGRFDERFFLYAEETDWQLRAQSRGWRVQEVPDVEAHHVGAATSSDEELRDRLFHGSAEAFVRKWYGTAGWTVFRAGSLAAAVRRWLVPGLADARVRRRQARAIRLYVRGPRRAVPDWAQT